MKLTQIKSLINSRDWKRRIKGYYCLGDASKTVIRKYLLAGMKDKNRIVRANIADYMGQSKDYVFVPHILKLLDDKSKFVQFYASIALGFYPKSKKLIEKPLIQALKHKDKGIRMFAAESLGDIKSQKAQRFLKKLAESDSNVTVRASAIDSIGYLHNKENITWLKKQIKKQGEEILPTIYAALIESGAKGFLKNLVPLLNDKKFRIRLITINRLHGVVADQVGFKKVLGVLIKQKKIEKSKTCQKALDKGIKYLKNKL